MNPQLLPRCLILLSLAAAPIQSHAERSLAWHWRNPLPQGDELRAVAQGNNTFVAVGDLGIIFTSPDAAVWTQQPTLSNSLYDVTFANNLFVAVGGNFTSTTSFSGDIFTSPDGAHWTTQNSDTTQPLTGIAYGAGRFVAVGPRQANSVSTDNGQTWLSYPSPRANSIAFGAGTFVAVGDFGAINTSTDGTDWTARPAGTNQSLNHVAFGNGLFVAVGETGTILTSPTGEVWTPRASGTTVILRSIAFMNNTFVATGDAGTILTSTTGVNWTPVNSHETVDLLGVGAGNGKFAAVGTSGIITTSPDSISWSRRTVAITLADLNHVTFGSAGFVAVGQAGTIVTSSNGLNWSLQNSDVGNELSRITFAQSRYVAVGTGGLILTSSNAIDWQPRASGTTRSLHGITFGHGMFVAVGDSGTVLTSPTGEAWTPRNPGTNFDLLSITFGNGLFVTTGPRSSSFMASSNAIDWVVGDLIQPVAYYDVAFGRRTFLAVGDSSTHNPFYIFQQSTNGLNWNFGAAVDGDGQHELTGVTYGNHMFMAVGFSGTVLSSIDEENFHDGDSGTAVWLHGVGFGNGTFVAVGSGGAILQSDPVIVMDIAHTNSSTAIALMGRPGSSYRIEATDQLGPNPPWQTLTNIIVGTNKTWWTDPRPPHSPTFYCTVANDNLIPNGDFETPGFNTAPDYRYLTSTESFSPTLGIQLPGWITRDDGTGEPPYIAKLPAYTDVVHGGNYAVALNQGSSIATTFPIQRDRSYTLTFWIHPADGSGNIAPDPLRLRIAGLTATLPATPGWTQKTYHFTAPTNDPAAPLEFSNDSPPGDWRTWNLDDIILKQDP